MRHKQSFISGAITLGVAGITAKFLGLFFRWPVTMLIGDEGIGLYQLAYPAYMFIIGAMSGFPIAISSMVSKRVALGGRVQAHRVFKYSLLVLTIIGLLSSILIYISAPYLIRILKWREEAYYSMIAVALAPAFVSIMNCFRGYFQGLQIMTLPAASQVAEQAGRVLFGVGLTYLLIPYGVSYSAAGASFGACAGAVIGCILLLGGYIKHRKAAVMYNGNSEHRESGAGIVGELLKTAIPISLGAAMGAMMALIDSIIVPSQLLSAGFSEKAATELYGQLSGKAHVLINVPLTFSMALGMSLVPAMSEVNALKSMERIKLRTESAVKVAIILGLPSAAGLFILADPILHMIFPGISEGAEVLRVLSISVLFIVMAQTLVSVLQGVGDLRSPVINLAIGAGVKLILGYILTSIPLLNIKGAAISSIAGHMVAALLNFKDAAKRTYFTFDADKMLLRPLASTMVMGIGVFAAYNKFIGLSGSNGISTIISIITGIIIYMLMLLLTGCISIKDITNYIKSKRSSK